MKRVPHTTDCDGSRELDLEAPGRRTEQLIAQVHEYRVYRL